MAWANMHELSSMYYGIYNVIFSVSVNQKFLTWLE